MTATVKVRIAVAVDDNGVWKSYGNFYASEQRTMVYASEGLDDCATRYWITAELPIPTTPEIAGTVEEAGE